MYQTDDKIEETYAEINIYNRREGTVRLHQYHDLDVWPKAVRCETMNLEDRLKGILI